MRKNAYLVKSNGLARTLLHGVGPNWKANFLPSVSIKLCFPFSAPHMVETAELPLRFPTFEAALYWDKEMAPGLTNHPLGQKGGEERHPLSISELPAHSHEARGANVKGTEDFS
jgi:hypothetical protein